MSADFSITKEATDKIRNLLKEHEGRHGITAVPAIVWVDSNLNNQIKESQPAIGFYSNRSEIDGQTTVVNGLELVIAVADQDRIHFRGKVLDYEGGRFVLKG
jgi:hypothetical protein